MTHHLKSNLFEAAQWEIFKLMHADPFPRFLKSCFYRAMYNSLNQKQVSIPNEVFEEIMLDADEQSDHGWGNCIIERNGVRVYKVLHCRLWLRSY